MSAPIATQPGQAAPRPVSQAQGGSAVCWLTAKMSNQYRGAGRPAARAAAVCGASVSSTMCQGVSQVQETKASAGPSESRPSASKLSNTPFSSTNRHISPCVLALTTWRWKSRPERYGPARRRARSRCACDSASARAPAICPCSVRALKHLYCARV